MKRLWILIFLLCCLLLSSCSTNALNEQTVEETGTEPSETTSVQQNETDETKPVQTESEVTENPPASNAKSDVSSEQDTETPSSSVPDHSESTSAEKETPTTHRTPESDSPAGDSTQSTEPPPKDEPVETTPTLSYATANDAQKIALLLAERINYYRAEQGATPAVYLPGLSAYAEYRSRQLIQNYAHDTLDERAAATALQYGEYIDPSLYGMSGEAYYTAGAREAIAQASFSGTVEEIAEQFAVLAKNSPGHWAYVGSSEYRYIGVGLTYSGGRWYCDIAMALNNSDEY